MAGAEAEQKMDMVRRASDRVRDALEAADGAAEVFMNPGTLSGIQGGFAVLRAENDMIMQGKVGRSHRA